MADIIFYSFLSSFLSYYLNVFLIICFSSLVFVCIYCLFLSIYYYYCNKSPTAKKNTALCMATHPKVLYLTSDPKLTYSTHIHNIAVEAHKPLQMIKALTATGWGKQKEILMATYKAVMRPALEHASSIWSPLACSTSINKLHVMQNAALRTATGWIQTYNICMTKHSYLPYTSTYSSTCHNTNTKHNIHHTPYANIQHTSTPQG